MPSRQLRGGLPAHGTRRSNDVGFLRIRHPQVAGELNLSEGALRVAVHRLRQRWGECLRAIVADTVDHPEAVEQEVRHLLTTMTR